MLATDVVVKVKGRVKVDDESVSLNASELTLPDISEAPTGPVVISLPAIRCTPAVLASVARCADPASGDDRGAGQAAEGRMETWSPG